MPSCRLLPLVLVLTAATAWAGEPRNLVPGRVLVKFQAFDAAQVETDADARQEVADVAARAGAALKLVRPALHGWGLYALEDRRRPGTALSEVETQVLVKVLEGQPEVEDATADRWYRPLATPSDPYLSQMWHLQLNGAATAWDLTTGLDTQLIGIVDTGLVNHEDVEAKNAGGYDFLSSATDAGDGDGRDADYTDVGTDGACSNGNANGAFHGTAVASIAAASTDNAKGLAGVNWKARVLMARALGRCGGPMSDIMDAASWLAGVPVTGVPALAQRATVVNMSLGGRGACTSYETAALQAMDQAGVVVVVAAGNDGSSVGSPANCELALAVAAHGPGATRPLTAYSNFGTEVDIVAPGGVTDVQPTDGILSAYGADRKSYAYYAGTSMAAPFVAGAVSLVLALKPTVGRAELLTWMQETGVACERCADKKALQLDALLAKANATAVTEPQTGGGSTTPQTPRRGCQQVLGSPADAAWLLLAGVAWRGRRTRR